MAEQTEPKTKQEVLDLIQDGWQLLEATLGKLSDAQKRAAGLDGERSVKDILAHITAWERLMLQWLKESYAGLTPQRPAPGMTWDDLDRLNEQIYLENKERGLAEIQAAYKSAYSHCVQAVQEMAEDDLFDGNRFAWRDGDPIWHMVAANTWWHYQEHREQIEAWRRGSAG
jgi:hypothetical protein